MILKKLRKMVNCNDASMTQISVLNFEPHIEIIGNNCQHLSSSVIN